jgi:hypothetical protein
VVVQEPATDAYFQATASDPIVLTVYAPQPDTSAQDGGWVVDPGTGSIPVPVSAANPHGNFGFSVHYKSCTSAQGQSVYTFRGSDGYDYIIKSDS